MCFRNIKASHILISGDGLVSLSGLNNLYSLVNSGQRSKTVYDFPQFNTSVLPWLSPELLRQVCVNYASFCLSRVSGYSGFFFKSCLLGLQKSNRGCTFQSLVLYFKVRNFASYIKTYILKVELVILISLPLLACCFLRK